MVVTKETELRKLRPAEFYNFALILSPSDNWKKLVSVVTREDDNNIPKFDGETIVIIEEASRNERKPAAAIFLEEWATMGKKRPTLGLLLDLLMKAQLFRAADYLAVDILKGEPPPRPKFGPAGRIDAEEALVRMLEQQKLKAEPNFRKPILCLNNTSEINLRDINYPMDILDTDTSDSDNNFAVGENDIGVIEIRYDQPRSNQGLEQARRITSGDDNRNGKKDFLDKSDKAESSIALTRDIKVSMKNISSESWNDSEISDLMKFSEASNEKNYNYNDENDFRSDMMKFDSTESDLQEMDKKNNEICKVSLPNLNNSREISLMKNDLKIGMDEKLNESGDPRKNINYDASPIREMSSTELPAILKEFQVSKYFHRELTSSELPLCINDRTGFQTSESDSSKEENSSENSSRISSHGSSEISRHSCTNESIENNNQDRESQNKIVKRFEKPNDAFNSQELPITVLEFQQR